MGTDAAHPASPAAGQRRCRPRSAHRLARCADCPVDARRRQSEAHTQTLLNTIGDAVLTIDQFGIIRSFNPAAERLFAYPAAEIVGQPIARLLPSVQGEPFDLPCPPTGGGELIGLKRDQTPLPLQVSLSELLSEQGRLFVAIIRDQSERKQLERQIVESGVREQVRIGQDLHDSLGQHLTGIAMMSQALAQGLADQQRPEAAHARRIAQLVCEAISQTRAVARGLSPVALQAGGLSGALRELADSTAQLFTIRCQCHLQEQPALDTAIATHLYRIAQEAVHNAVRHGRARHIDLRLLRRDDTLQLLIEDDGLGLSPSAPPPAGLGLQIMAWRAQAIGATFELFNRPTGGVCARCVLPLFTSGSSADKEP